MSYFRTFKTGDNGGNNMKKSTSTDEWDGHYMYRSWYGHGPKMFMVQTPEGYVGADYIGIDSHRNYAYYYYVHNHLGNVRITRNSQGYYADQSLEYYSSGVLFDRSAEKERQPYMFGGKELVSMHGLNEYDFTGRWQDPGISSFTSIDPLCEKYYSVSPYVYCANNPVKYIDPNGKNIVIWYQNMDGKQVSFTFNGQNGATAPNNNFVSSVITAYNYNVKNGGGRNLKIAATSDKFNIAVVETANDNKAQDGLVRFNPTAGLQLNDGNIISPATGLEHEVAHAVRSKTGKKNSTRDSEYDTKEERSIITGTELETAKANGELPKNHKGRRSHAEGNWVVTKSVTSNQELDKHSSEELRIRIDKFYSGWTSEW